VGPDSGICPVSPNGLLKDLRLGGRPVVTAPAAIAFKKNAVAYRAMGTRAGGEVFQD